MNRFSLLFSISALFSVCAAHADHSEIALNSPPWSYKEPITKDSAASKPPLSCAPAYDNQLWFEADFLYWFAKQEGNQYAVTGGAITVPGTEDPNTHLTPNPIKRGKVYELDFQIQPGYKLGGGIDLSYGNWDLFAEYTYLHSHAKGSVHSDDLNAGIIPSFSYSANNSILTYATYAAASGAQGFVSKASSSWSLSFNNINLDLGRKLCVSKFLSLHPYIGLQGSWQKQDFDTSYYLSSFTNSSVKLGKNKVIFDQSFWGVGLRAGIDSTWQCFRHLDLFASLGTAALWGQFKCEGRSYDSNAIEDYQNVLIDSQLNYLHSLSPIVTLEIGLQSGWAFSPHRQIVLKAGWENQIWFFQNQHSSAIADTSLILQGLTAQLRFMF